MENWKDLVGLYDYGYENISEYTKEVMVFYLKHNDIKPDNTDVTIKMVKDKVTLDLTEEEMMSKLDEILTSFPVYEYTETDDETTLQLVKLRVGNLVARQSKRGFAKVEYKNSIFYRGTYVSDKAVIVAHANGKYGIFKHPDFDKYGYNLVAVKKKES